MSSIHFPLLDLAAHRISLLVLPNLASNSSRAASVTLLAKARAFSTRGCTGLGTRQANERRATNGDRVWRESATSVTGDASHLNRDDVRCFGSSVSTMSKRVYLAGPEVFLSSAREIGARDRPFLDHVVCGDAVRVRATGEQEESPMAWRLDPSRRTTISCSSAGSSLPAGA
jgi:hypothetical protein